jgi:hypothetical protein
MFKKTSNIDLNSEYVQQNIFFHKLAVHRNSSTQGGQGAPEVGASKRGRKGKTRTESFFDVKL